MAMEISKAIFFLQTLNGHGNFHVSFWQAQNGHGNFHGHFLFTPMLTKGRVYKVVAGGGLGKGVFLCVLCGVIAENPKDFKH